MIHVDPDVTTKAFRHSSYIAHSTEDLVMDYLEILHQLLRIAASVLQRTFIMVSTYLSFNWSSS
jgi:hypothetical protein